MGSEYSYAIVIPDKENPNDIQKVNKLEESKTLSHYSIGRWFTSLAYVPLFIYVKINLPKKEELEKVKWIKLPIPSLKITYD